MAATLALMAHDTPDRHTRPRQIMTGKAPLIEEFARQRAGLAADRASRLGGAMAAFALAAPFAGGWPLLLAAAAYLTCEIVQFGLFAALDRGFRPALYRLTLLVSASGATAYAVPAVLLWQADDDMLNVAAILFLTGALINAAIARATHLPFGAVTALPPGMALLWMTAPGTGAPAPADLLALGTTVALLVYLATAMRAHNLAQRGRARALGTAQQASAAKSRFITAISHDLRTPLNAILGTAQNIAAATGDAGLRAQVRTIEGAAEELRRLLDAGLDMVQGADPAPRATPLPPVAAGAHPPAPPDAATPAGRILVVDDIATNRLVLMQMLRHAGHDAAEAEGGAAALRALADGHFDLVIMDLNMPGMTGAQTTAAIRAGRMRAQVPVLAITADAELVRGRDALLAKGIDGLIVKPVDAGQVLAEVARLIASSRRDIAARGGAG